MNFATLVRLAQIDGFDAINIYDMQGEGVRICLETHEVSFAAVSMLELPNLTFGHGLLCEAIEDRQALVEQGWDLSFDSRSIRLRRMSMSDILAVFDAPRAHTNVA